MTYSSSRRRGANYLAHINGQSVHRHRESGGASEPRSHQSAGQRLSATPFRNEHLAHRRPSTQGSPHPRICHRTFDRMYLHHRIIHVAKLRCRRNPGSRQFTSAQAGSRNSGRRLEHHHTHLERRHRPSRNFIGDRHHRHASHHRHRCW